MGNTNGFLYLGQTATVTVGAYQWRPTLLPDPSPASSHEDLRRGADSPELCC